MYLIPAVGFSVDLPYIIHYGAFNSWGQIGFGICLPPPARKNNNTVYTLRPPLIFWWSSTPRGESSHVGTQTRVPVIRNTAKRRG